MKENYKELAMKIANEGLGYYLQFYGAESSDPELQKLFDEAETALDKITKYFKAKGVDLNEY